MSEADDVLHSIDQLRRDLSGYHGQLKAHNDLQRHCDNQRKRIGELEALYAGAKAEIAELREMVHALLQCNVEGDDICAKCNYRSPLHGGCMADVKADELGVDV